MLKEEEKQFGLGSVLVCVTRKFASLRKQEQEEWMCIPSKNSNIVNVHSVMIWVSDGTDFVFYIAKAIYKRILINISYKDMASKKNTNTYIAK